MSLRQTIHSCAEQLAVARRSFVTAPFYLRGRARDQLLIDLAYGVQNCLRSLAMQFPASGTEARSGETEGLDPKDDDPTGNAGDAQTDAQTGGSNG